MFHLDYSPVGSGKSYRAVKWLASDPSSRVVLVGRLRQAELLLIEAKRFWPESGITAQNFVTPYQLEIYAFREGIEVYIDQIDQMLSQLVGAPVVGASWTETEDGPNGLVRRKLIIDQGPRPRESTVATSHFALVKTPA